MSEDERYVYCRISDPGQGLRCAAQAPGYQSKGQGLTLRRLELIYKSYGCRPYIRRVEREGGGSIVTVAIPKV